MGIFKGVLQSNPEVLIANTLYKCEMSEIEYEMSKIENVPCAIESIFAKQ